jgi:DNA-binding LacI/PurR family transcriptional regulator
MTKRKRAPSAKSAKMTDLARLAGVHVSTVSRALAGSRLIAPSQREKILNLARERGYVLNKAASNLRLQRTQTLSVVIPLHHETGQALSDPFFISMLGYLADEITQRGYGMFLKKVLPPGKDWLQVLINSHRSDGTIVIGQSTEHASIEAAAKSYRPLVVWGGHLQQQSYCTVGATTLEVLAPRWNTSSWAAASESCSWGTRRSPRFVFGTMDTGLRLRRLHVVPQAISR